MQLRQRYAQVVWLLWAAIAVADLMAITYSISHHDHSLAALWGVLALWLVVMHRVMEWLDGHDN